MSTTVRPKISDNSPYYIEKHRYYELKHFCLQYSTWLKQYTILSGYSRSPTLYSVKSGTEHGNPTARIAEQMAYYSRRMDTVKKAAYDTDGVLGSYIFKAVTEGLLYESLKTQYDIPCCRGSYYELYRRFFKLLDEYRG